LGDNGCRGDACIFSEDALAQCARGARRTIPSNDNNGSHIFGNKVFDPFMRAMIANLWAPDSFY
jgi:hypothetical protein